MICILYTFLLISLSHQVQLYQKIVHNIDPEARCLDGSPGLLYLHQGLEKDKFLIHFEGGGFCAGLTLAETIDFCYNRSKTHLGSSIYWPDQKQYDGYLSTDATNQFSSWTKVVFGYCDGSLHQGHRQQPISYKGSRLYFRGAALAKSHFKWLVETLHLDTATKVMLTGESAGGVASYLWSNYLQQEILMNPKVLVTVPDSGVFLPFKAYAIGQDILSIAIQNMYKLANLDQPTPMSQCNQAFPQQGWQCLFLSNSFSEIKAPLFIINSEYDSWVIANTLQIKCLTAGVSGYTIANCSSPQKSFIESYRADFIHFRDKYLSVEKNSAWNIGCSHHGYAYDDNFYDSDLERVPGSEGDTVKQALLKFIQGRRVIEIESNPWPSNSKCAY